MNKKYKPEHLAIIDGWCRRYPKNKGIDMKMVRANDPAALAELAAAGFPEKIVYQKAAYHRERVIKDVAPRKSLSRSLSRKVEGGYQCYLCPHVAGSGAKLAAHVRYKHPGQSRTMKWRKKGMAISVTTGQPVTVPELQNGEHVMTVHCDPQLINQFVIIGEDRVVARAKLVNYCPSCGSNMQAHHAASNI